VEVIKKPVISVISTGNELVELNSSLNNSQIYDSNSYGICAAVESCGGIANRVGIARDSIEELEDALNQCSDSDMIITSAGVSKGDYDVVKDVLQRNGNINFWSVKMRPAKPLAFGIVTLKGKNIPLIGLPGNPVSALVAFEMFGRPSILKMLGKQNWVRPTVQGKLNGTINNFDGRRVYARVEVVNINGEFIATPTGPQGSNILTSMSKANGLAICPEDEISKNDGETVSIIMINWNEEVIT
jgi:molybdopterin molybdotransferase